MTLVPGVDKNVIEYFFYLKWAILHRGLLSKFKQLFEHLQVTAGGTKLTQGIILLVVGSNRKPSLITTGKASLVGSIPLVGSSFGIT